MSKVVQKQEGKTIADSAIDSVKAEFGSQDRLSELQSSHYRIVEDGENSYPVRVQRNVIYEARNLRGELTGERLLIAPVKAKGEAITMKARGSDHYFEIAENHIDELDRHLNGAMKAMVWVFVVLLMLAIGLAVGWVG